MIRIVMDALYNGKAVGGKTICFSAKVDPKQQFTFPTVTRFVSCSNIKDKVVYCTCLKGLEKLVWEIADSLLDDNDR